jgi:hypothetical protein
MKSCHSVFRAGYLVCSGADCDGTRWVSDVEQVGRAHQRCVLGLYEHIGHMSTQEVEAEVIDA